MFDVALSHDEDEILSFGLNDAAIQAINGGFLSIGAAARTHHDARRPCTRAAPVCAPDEGLTLVELLVDRVTTA